VTQKGKILGPDLHEKIVEILELLLEGPPEEEEKVKSSTPLGQWAHDAFWKTAKDELGIKDDFPLWDSVLGWIHRFQVFMFLYCTTQEINGCLNYACSASIIYSTIN